MLFFGSLNVRKFLRSGRVHELCFVTNMLVGHFFFKITHPRLVRPTSDGSALGKYHYFTHTGVGDRPHDLCGEHYTAIP